MLPRTCTRKDGSILMLRRTLVVSTLAWLLTTGLVWGNPPVGSYVFPAGGQRGTTVQVRVGGLFLHQECGFEMLGPGIEASQRLQRTRTLWFEGPLLPLPDSQQAEDYPRDMAGQVRIAADAPLGFRYWRLWTSQGSAPASRFMVGSLPEIVEAEIEGDPVPVEVRLPVTVNGRIFPREDVDLWSFQARQGQTITCEVHAARLGTPLDARLEVLDPTGRRIQENDDTFGGDPFLRFTAPVEGNYQVRIHDIQSRGSQSHVYRLTLTADPVVDRVYPLGGRRGSRVKFELSGQGVPPGSVEIPLPADAPRDYVYPGDVQGGSTPPFLLDLDDLPEQQESEPNDDPTRVQPVQVPAVLNGRIGKPGDTDFWAFTAQKGEVWEIELRANRLGSPLTGVLAVLAGSGKELARTDAVAAGVADPSLRFQVPADGTYRVRVEERFRGRGGPAHAYRLRLDRPAAPGFRLQLPADVVTVPRGGQAALKLNAERLGNFADAINLEVEGLPTGITLTGTTIPARQTAATLMFKAEATAAIRTSHLRIRGNARVGDQTLTQAAALPVPRGTQLLDQVLLAVAMPTPFKIVSDHAMKWAPRGSVYQRHYRIERNGYEGPIEVSLSDRQARHLQGVTGPTITVPAGLSEFDYPVSLPPWMETGRTCRVVVMGVGIIRDTEGVEHRVSYYSTQPNEQVIVVVEPGQLGVELERTSIAAVAGREVILTGRVSRGRELRGPARLELIVPAHFRGVKAEPVTVPADQGRFALPIRFGSDLGGPFHLPITLRATIMDRGHPVTGEARVEVLWDR